MLVRKEFRVRPPTHLLFTSPTLTRLKHGDKAQMCPARGVLGLHTPDAAHWLPWLPLEGKCSKFRLYIGRGLKAFEIKVGLPSCQQQPRTSSIVAWVRKASPAHISQMLWEAHFLCATRPVLSMGLRLGCWGAGIAVVGRAVASMLRETLHDTEVRPYWNTAAHIVGPARGSKLAGDPVLIHMGFLWVWANSPVDGHQVPRAHMCQVHRVLVAVLPSGSH